MRTVSAGPTKRELTSKLPEPLAGEPFDLLKTLKRCTGMLTQADACRLLGKGRNTISRAVRAGKIPTLDVGVGEKVIDPSLWAAQIELRNPHIAFTHRAAARRAA